MRYIFYADVYFIQNFMIKIAVLYLSLYCNKSYTHTVTLKRVGKIVIAAFFGTIIEILGLLWSSSYQLYILCIHLFEVPLMMRFVLGKAKRKMLCMILSGYFFIMLINGFLEILWNQFGEWGSYFFYLMFSCGVVIIGVRMWKNYSKMNKGIFIVQLCHQRNYITTQGFYDSGNRLTDPYTGKGVHIVSEQLWKMLKLHDETAVFVPFQALGSQNGMIEVYYIDELIIEGGNERKIIQKCPLGVTKDNLFEGKKYEIILNEEVF